MKLIKIAALSLAVLAVLVLGIGLLLPAQVTLEESVQVAAPPSAIYGYLNNLKQWDRWTLWRERDPGMVSKFEGPAEGVGATHKWEGADGKSKLVIRQSIPGRELAYDYEKPDYAIVSRGWLTLVPNTAGTRIVWRLESERVENPLWRIFRYFNKNEAAETLRQSLERLKLLVEKNPDPYLVMTEVTETHLPATKYVSIRTNLKPAEMQAFFDKSFRELPAYLGQQGAVVAGPPFAIYHKFTDTEVDMEAAFPTSKPVPASGRIQYFETPAQKAYKTVHLGPYATLKGTYDQFMAWLDARQMPKGEKVFWEVYVTNPMAESDTSKWVTEIYYLPH